MIKKVLKKLVNNIELLLLISLLLIIIITTIRKDNFYEMPLMIINGIMALYLLIRVIRKNPMKLIKSKLDICVILFVLSATIPLICNTYISLDETIISILNYISLFWVYLLTREMTDKNKKGAQRISNLIIGIAVFFVILGIENLTTNVIANWFSIDDIINGEQRLVSLLGNPNELAVFLVFAFFLSIDKLINKESIKGKLIYSTVNTILTVGIILTYSKAIYLIFPVMLVIYMCILKNKTKNIVIIQNAITSLIIAMIYNYSFNNFLATQGYLAILVVSIFTLIITILINLLNIKLEKYIEKVKVLPIVIGIIIVCILATTWIAIQLRNPKEFEVFHEDSTQIYNAKKIRNIKPNQKYVFSFDMEAEYDVSKLKENEKFFTINIIQRDNKNIEIANKQETFSNFSGIKNIEIETSQTTAEIKIEFMAKYENINKKWTIKKLTMNEEEIILEYKNLPTKLVEKVKDISINYKTAQERMQFIKDGIKLIMQSPLTGLGGGGWKYSYVEIQQYDYIANDPHSFFIQTWIESGILGMISLVAMIIYAIKTKNTNLGIKIAMIALILHSFMDSNMCYVYMRVILFLSLGILATTSKKTPTKKDYYSNFILLAITIVIVVLALNPKVYSKTMIIEELEEKQTQTKLTEGEYKELKKQLAKEYDKITKYEKSSSQIYEYQARSVLNYIQSGEENMAPVVQRYYETMLNTKRTAKYNIAKICEKSNNISMILQKLQSLNKPELYMKMAKLAKIEIDEFEETKEILEKAILEKYKQIKLDTNYNLFLYNHEYALYIYEKYNLGVGINNATELDLSQYIENEQIKMDNKKDILIYHTHTTEAYNENYEKTEDGKTLNSNYNMLKIGTTFTQKLKEKGFSVIHEQTYHDKDGVDSAYDNAKKTVEQNLENNKNIEMLFDVHRDAYIEGMNKQNYIEIDGKKVANLRFVIGTAHDNWKNNLKWAITIQKKADEMYPGLFKDIYIYDNNYNQSLSKYATLIEVGNDKNTIEEAKLSVEYLAEIIAKVIE